VFAQRAAQAAADVEVLRAAGIRAVGVQPAGVNQVGVGLALDDADEVIVVDLGVQAEAP
jgi:hypothetical protein